MVAFVVSSASGFIGGPIFPVLFMGGTAGTVVHELLPAVPLGLAFSCMLAAVPGSVVVSAVLDGAPRRAVHPGRLAAWRGGVSLVRPSPPGVSCETSTASGTVVQVCDTGPGRAGLEQPETDGVRQPRP